MSSTSDNSASSYTPLSSPLPPPPEEDVFTPDQWAVLLAIADTIIPSISDHGSADPSSQLSVPRSDLDAARTHLKRSLDEPQSEQSDRLINSYLEENASSVPQFKDSLKSLFSRHIHHEGRKGLGMVLTALKYALSPLTPRTIPTRH